MTPMSAIALLIASQLWWLRPPWPPDCQPALPAILLMEVLGAVIATWPSPCGRKLENSCPRAVAQQPGNATMRFEAFHHSEPLTLGVELELQLVNTNDYDQSADDMLRLMKKTLLPGSVVPEMTNSMIEISTGICPLVQQSEVLGPAHPIRDALVKKRRQAQHRRGRWHAPVPEWHERRISTSRAFANCRTGGLSKQFTIFGQHVHITGCPSANAACSCCTA